MSYEVSCPSCGSAVIFAFDASIIRVCSSCRSLLVRDGARIENAGLVAELVSTPSLLLLGETGSYQGDSFQIVGRVQVEHPAGLWDEWRIAFSDGRLGWLAESLGRRHLLLDVDPGDLPAFSQCRPGERIRGRSAMMVIDVGVATVKTLEGELPQDLRPGETWNYADLAGPKGAFATIDFGDGEAARAMYLGRAATLEQLGLGHLGREAGFAKAAAQALQCPECRGALTLRLPDLSKRVACPYCGTLLAVEGSLQAIEAADKQNKLSFEPAFKLGAKARLDGVTWVVLGAMERSSGPSDYTRYSWREYLLHEPIRGFRWLVEDRGHWTVVDNAHAGDLEMGTKRRFGGQTFRHFVSSEARVDSLVGEFPWAVTRGEITQAADYIAPPLILSEESTATEFNLSLGRYIESADVAQAFGIAAPALPRKEGVHAAQPNPYQGRVGPLWLWFLALSAVLVVIFLFSATRSRTVFQTTVRLPPGAVSGSPQAVFISEPFQVTGSGNVRVKVYAPLDNSWLYLDGTLANTKAEAVGDFEMEAGFYRGADQDGAWSEGSGEAVAFLGGVPPGEYTLRLAPQWGVVGRSKRVLKDFQVEVRRGVPRASYLLIALVLIFLWPAWVTSRSSSFETARWSESDHAGS